MKWVNYSVFKVQLRLGLGFWRFPFRAIYSYYINTTKASRVWEEFFFAPGAVGCNASNFRGCRGCDRACNTPVESESFLAWDATAQIKNYSSRSRACIYRCVSLACYSTYRFWQISYSPFRLKHLYCISAIESDTYKIRSYNRSSPAPGYTGRVFSYENRKS